jgi:phosphatidate cytidylyltransferase
MRLASAVVIIGLVVSVIWLLPPWVMAVAAAATAAAAGTELSRMARAVDADVPASFVGLASAALAVAFVIYEPRVPGSEVDSLHAVMLAVLVASAVAALVLGPPTRATFSRIAVLVMVPVYVGLPLGTLVWVQWLFGPAAVTWLIATIAVSDSAQYYGGRALGRRKLAPTISPAKTIEGLVAGVVAAALMGAVLGPPVLPGLTPLVGMVLAVVLATFGVVGDLFESLLKRSAGVKDSSHLIPGHGGVLDRIDSYLMASPVFYLFLRYVA